MTFARIPFRILCIGDGLTKGFSQVGGPLTPYADILQRRLLNDKYIKDRELKVAVDHLGYTGFSAWRILNSSHMIACFETTAKVFSQGFVHSLRARDYHLAIVLAGSKDISQGEETTDILSNLLRIYNLCYECRVCHVLAVGIPDTPFMRKTQGANDQRCELNQHLQDVGRACPDRATFVNLAIDYEPDSALLFQADGIHLTEKGAQRLSDAVFSAVKTQFLKMHHSGLPHLPREMLTRDSIRRKNRNSTWKPWTPDQGFSPLFKI